MSNDLLPSTLLRLHSPSLPLHWLPSSRAALTERCRLSLARSPPPPLIVFQTVFFLPRPPGGETNEPACVEKRRISAQTNCLHAQRQSPVVFVDDCCAFVPPISNGRSCRRPCLWSSVSSQALFFLFFSGISVVVALPAERLIGFLVPHLTCGVRRTWQSSLQCCVWR